MIFYKVFIPTTGVLPFLELLNGVRLRALQVCSTQGVQWRDLDRARHDRILLRIRVKHFTLRSQKKELKISNFFSCFQNFMIIWEKLIKIGKAGGNTSNRDRERVGISGSVLF